MQHASSTADDVMFMFAAASARWLALHTCQLVLSLLKQLLMPVTSG